MELCDRGGRSTTHRNHRGTACLNGHFRGPFVTVLVTVNCDKEKRPRKSRQSQYLRGRQFVKRREGDSNPRSGYPDTAFPVLHNRPLCHLSERAKRLVLRSLQTYLRVAETNTTVHLVFRNAVGVFSTAQTAYFRRRSINHCQLWEFYSLCAPSKPSYFTFRQVFWDNLIAFSTPHRNRRTGSFTTNE